MEYIKIIDSNNVVLAYLNNITDGYVKQVVNGEYSINFTALIEELKTVFLYDTNNLLEYNNDYFNIVTIDEIHNENNMLMVNVYAEHICYDLLNITYNSFTYNNKTAIEVLTACLQDTGFTLSPSTNVTGVHSISLENATAKEVLYKIANIWGGELEFFRNSIALKTQIGTNRNVDFRFGKNVSNIKRHINHADDSVSYEVLVCNYAELDELGKYYLGDTIRVIDDRLNVDILIRIVELQKDIVTGLNNNVVLGNQIGGIGNVVSNLNNSINTVSTSVNNIIDVHGDLIASKISGSLSTANTIIKNATSHVIFDTQGIKALDQPIESEATKIVAVVSDGIGVANSRNQDGSWNFRTAITGDGINADEINAGTLTAININGVNITSSTFKNVSDGEALELTANHFKYYNVSTPDEGMVIKANSNNFKILPYKNPENWANAYYGVEINSINEQMLLMQSAYDVTNSKFEKAAYLEISKPKTGMSFDSDLFTVKVNVVFNSAITDPTTNSFNVVNGVKNCIHSTLNFGEIQYSAYEMATVMLGDVGTNFTDMYCTCKICINEILKESINTKIKYYVFIQALGNGYLWIDEQTEDYFVVKSNVPNLPFDFEIKGFRRGFEARNYVCNDNNDEIKKMSKLQTYF